MLFFVASLQTTQTAFPLCMYVCMYVCVCVLCHTTEDTIGKLETVVPLMTMMMMTNEDDGRKGRLEAVLEIL